MPHFDFRTVVDSVSRSLDALPRWCADQVRQYSELVEHGHQEVEARRNNPVVHHWTVTRNVLEIAAGLGKDAQFVRNASIAALGHDLSAEPKLLSGGPGTEAQRTGARLIHMFEGAALAVAAMRQMDQPVAVFNPDDYFEIGYAIASHDCPSLHRPFAVPSELLTVLAAADALWMIEFPDGPRADLWRDERDSEDVGLLRRQVERNLRKIKERAAAASDGNSSANGALMGLQPAFAIFSRHLERWAAFFQTTPEALQAGCDN